MRRRRSVIHWLLLFFLVGGTTTAPSVWAEWESLPEKENINAPGFRQEVVQGALQGLKAAVELWKGQNFDGLYELGTAESRHLLSKEQFIRLMKNSDKQLQCCWATLQDLEGFFESPTQVNVRAKLGYENFQSKQIDTPDQDTEPAQWIITSSFDLRTFLMVLQQGHWRIDLTEILKASMIFPDSQGFTRIDKP